MTELQMCETHCGAAAVTTFSAARETIHRLGLPAPVDGQPVLLRLCAGCYLTAMSLMLDRAGLPRPLPLPVEFYCKACEKVIPTADVVFVGPSRVTPVHGTHPAHHALQVRVLRSNGVVATLQTGPSGVVLG